MLEMKMMVKPVQTQRDTRRTETRRQRLPTGQRRSPEPPGWKHLYVIYTKAVMIKDHLQVLYRNPERDKEETSSGAGLTFGGDRPAAAEEGGGAKTISLKPGTRISFYLLPAIVLLRHHRLAPAAFSPCHIGHVWFFQSQRGGAEFSIQPSVVQSCQN